MSITKLLSLAGFDQPQFTSDEDKCLWGASFKDADKPGLQKPAYLHGLLAWQRRPA